MSSYVVTHAGRETSEPFSNYLFDVHCDGRKLAELGHDYRGDEHWMRKPGGAWIALPERVISGGGPQPVFLSIEGIRAVDKLIASGL